MLDLMSKKIIAILNSFFLPVMDICIVMDLSNLFDTITLSAKGQVSLSKCTVSPQILCCLHAHSRVMDEDLCQILRF